MASPAFDHDLRFTQRVEDLAVEQLVAQAGVEALHVPVLPWAAGRDVGRSGTHRGDPVLHCLGDELWPVVRPDVSGHAAQDEEVGQNLDHISGFQFAIDADRQAFMGELVDHVEHAVPPSVMGSILDEVVRPNVIAVLRAQPDARAVREPQTAAFGLLLRNLQPLTPPDPLDPLVIDQPARMPQQSCNLAVAVTAILAGQLDDVGGQPLLVVAALWHLALRRAMLAESRTGAALGHLKLTSNMLDAGTAACGA